MCFVSSALGEKNLLKRFDKGLKISHIFLLRVVAGGRSRLHLIDLGGCANRSGGLPLSGVGNVVLSILSGQRHPPNRDHPLTPLLKDCLAPLTCHVAIIAHVTHSQVQYSHLFARLSVHLHFFFFLIN